VRGSASAEMRARLENWKKEATVHHTLTERNNGRFTLALMAARRNACRARPVSAGSRLPARWPRDWRLSQQSHLVTLYTEQQFRDITRSPEWADVSSTERFACPSGAPLRISRSSTASSRPTAHARDDLRLAQQTVIAQKPRDSGVAARARIRAVADAPALGLPGVTCPAGPARRSSRA